MSNKSQPSERFQRINNRLGITEKIEDAEVPEESMRLLKFYLGSEPGPNLDADQTAEVERALTVLYREAIRTAVRLAAELKTPETEDEPENSSGVPAGPEEPIILFRAHDGQAFAQLSATAAERAGGEVINIQHVGPQWFVWIRIEEANVERFNSLDKQLREQPHKALNSDE